jgi:hypothetical protein
MLSTKQSERARDRGLDKLFATADFWRAYSAVALAASLNHELTSDEAWSLLEAAGITRFLHPNVVGAAFTSAASKGLITQTSRFRKSSRVSAHRRNVQVWRSLLFVEVTGGR